jgi:hypothetical protein
MFVPYFEEARPNPQQTRADTLSVPAVRTSSAICCMTSEAILGIGGNQMSENRVRKLLGTGGGKR